jgi:hypothetical protein
MFIKSSHQWTADIIKHEIEKLILKWGDVKYFVADGGNAICKSIELLHKVHIYDITHKMAWMLKNTYEKDELFIKYTKEMAQMRFKGICSDFSHVIPPKQRSDSRFMNLDILSDWGLKALKCLENLKNGSKIYEKLLWVKDYQPLIAELDLINVSLTKIRALLKTNGLSKKMLSQVSKILKGLTSSKRLIKFKHNLLNFLEETIKLLPKEAKILCTSDIIESSFGKYKNYMSQNSMAGFTDLTLCLAAFTNTLDPEQLLITLEQTKMKDLKEWSKNNIGETNFSKRKKVLMNRRG